MPALRAEQELVDEHGHPVLVVISRDQVGGRPDLRGGVPHGHAQPGMADHRDVVRVVAHGADLGGVDVPEAGEVEDGRPLARIASEDLAHRAQVTRAALDERLHLAVQAFVGGPLEGEHLGPRADRTDVEEAALMEPGPWFSRAERCLPSRRPPRHARGSGGRSRRRTSGRWDTRR